MLERQALKPNCPQCGGPVEVPEGAAYASCTYCSAQSFVDLGGAILHQVIRPSVPRSSVAGLVKARALETGWPDATVGEFTLIHEPVWEVERPDGRRIQLSARPGPQGRFAQVRTPGGERALVEPRLHKSSSEWIEPQLAPESLPEVAARVLGQPIAIKTVRLIHHPIFQGTVRIAGVSYPFHLDAVSGELIDVNWPIQATYARRNRAWLATAAMLAAAALLPLPIAAVAALAIVGLAALTLSRRDPTPAASRS